ncbi:MAG: hypothetical protein QOI25_626 [Mycobacterium sp.]|nr:hypothetical protein [Mycobacterium sp.]
MKRYLASTFSALGVRDYRRFAFGQAISVSGTWMQKLAQAWLVLELTNSPLLLGLTVAMQQIPTLLFTTVGGALADRFDKRTILLWMAIGATLPALVLGVLVQLDLVQVWIVMLAALIQGLLDAVDKPARLTVVNDIATPATLTNAVMFNGIIQDSGKVAGPAIAGILIASVGISAAFFINAFSYLPVIVALLLIKPRVPVGPVATFKATGNLTGTLRYVAKHPKLAAALGLMAVAGLLAYNWNVLLPTLTRDVFDGDARMVGFGFTSMGLGAVLGGLALAGFLKPSSSRLILNGCVFATFLVLLGLAPTVGVAYVLLFGVGAFSVAFRATATTLLQLYADPQMRGRVISLLVLATAGTTPFGGPLIGWICEHASPRVACVVGGFGTALAALACFVYLQVKRSAAEAEGDETAGHYERATSRSSDGSAAKMEWRSSSESRPT